MDELQFNEAKKPITLQLSLPILDIDNYTISANEIAVVNTTNTTSNITIFDNFNTDFVTLSLFAMDVFGFPIFASFDIYLGDIPMPVRIVFPNGTAAADITVTANLTDYPSVSQSGSTNTNGTIIFRNVPFRTISFLARTKENFIGFTGMVPTVNGATIVLNTFENGTSQEKNIILDETQPNLMINGSANSKQRNYRQKMSVSGFTITTSGEGLTATSRQFLSDSNSTKIHVRYKFVTSEVPGGYFGSRFNDYYTVSIRAASGSLETISQSMNALGLGAFDYNSGATDWFILTLSLGGKAEVIRVDVGVANVGDGSYQSSIIVDKISDDKCDKCDDCINCQSDPMCESNCMNPPQRSCLFYTNCMEKKVSCGSYGYAINYGFKYCNKYARKIDLFTSNGQTWVYETMNCLQRALVTPLKQCENNCETLKDLAFASHPKCYIYSGSGVCTLDWSDWIQIMLIVSKDLTSVASLKQALQTFAGCAVKLTADLVTEIADATLVAWEIIRRRIFLTWLQLILRLIPLPVVPSLPYVPILS